MPKYAEWDDIQYGGRNNRIVKGSKTIQVDNKRM